MATPKRVAALAARLVGEPSVTHAIPYRDPVAVDGDSESLSRDELAMVLRIVPAKWRPLFQTLAATGIRWSEAAGLKWGDLKLDGSETSLRVRHAYVRDTFKPPKSKYGVRTIPIDMALARALREHRRRSKFSADADLVFPARNGAPLRQENVRRRVMAPAAGEAGVPWIGFHTFRHTCASLLFDSGRNAVQVQRILGHHSPAFTLSVYVHLLDEGVGGPLDLGAALAAGGGNKVATHATGSEGIAPDRPLAETVS